MSVEHAMTQVGQVPPRILIAEDDQVVGYAYSQLFKRAGFDVTLVTSGSALLTTFPQLHPDGILVDIMMPGMDGPQAIRALRALPGGSTIPIYAVTNAFIPLFIDSAKQAGANDVFPKATLKPEELVNTFRSHVKSRRLQEDSARVYSYSYKPVS
jgi:two-component system OmpR family response regulator